jgi:glycine/D-amino acid oxidase-like deaminating enzyme
VLDTAGGCRITSRTAVFATGYESLGFIDRRQAQIVSTYALVSRPRRHWPPGLEACVFTETRDPYLYVRSTADGRIMIGGEDEPFSNPSTRARHLARSTRALLKRLDRWFPDLHPAVSRAWAGAFAVTHDGLGYVAQARKYPNCLFVIGAGGNGMVFSMIASDILRDLVRGKSNRDAHLFRLDRPWNRTRRVRR